jgi:hypothetical protein
MTNDDRDMLRAGFLFGLIMALKEVIDSSIKELREEERRGSHEFRRPRRRESFLCVLR